MGDDGSGVTARQVNDKDFPCSLTICTPFPTHRLASFAMQALRVDAELSPLVRRSFSLANRGGNASHPAVALDDGKALGDGKKMIAQVTSAPTAGEESDADEEKVVLKTLYQATTNRMLRVAVNGFMDSLALVIDVMEHLDVDVLAQAVGAPA